jgi:DNA polymerase III gamma/tau subunit
MIYFQKIPENQELSYEFFTNALIKGRLARAYLLCGGANQIKIELVKELNKILNCEINQDGSDILKPSCQSCINCRWISENNHPKTPIIIESESKKGNISIEQIRNLQNELSQACDYFRIIIIKDASREGLNQNSSAALLKTIEEARPRTMFILLSSNRETVLPTISSRAQTLYLNGFEPEAINEKAEELFEDLKSSLENHSLDDYLNLILKAEEFSENERIDLINMLELWQNNLANDLETCPADNITELCNKILKIEQGIVDIKSFVRTRAVLVSSFG